jgi:hypothetical protein
MSTQTLLAEIEDFLGRPDVKMTESTFGRLAVNDGKFMTRLREGRRIWPETAEKARAYIASNSSDVRESNAPIPSTSERAA